MNKWEINSKCLGLLVTVLCLSNYGRLEAQTSRYSDSLQIKIFQDQAEVWYMQNFDSVLKYSCAAIDIAKRNEDIFLKEHLDALIRICWSSSLYNRLHETDKYLNEGNELLDRYSGKIALFDTTGYYRSAFIFTRGMYFFEQGNYKDAITEFSKAVPLSGKALTSDHDLLYSFCSFLGQCYFKTGNYDRALQYYELGLEYKQQPGTASEKNPMSFLYEGQYNFAIGKTDEAFVLFQKALDILRKEKLSQVRNTLHSNYLLIAGYHMKSGHFDNAVSMVKRSIAIAGVNSYLKCVSYCTLGEIFYSEKMIDSASSNFNKALYLVDNNMVALVQLKYRPLWGIANIERDKMNFEKAEQLYNEGIANDIYIKTGKGSSGPVLHAISFMSMMLDRAQLYYQWFTTVKKTALADTCLITLERAMAVSDMSRKGLFRMDTKEAKAELQSKIADLGTEISFRAFEITKDRNYLWKAFAFIEKNKSNILHDKVDDLRALSFSNIPKDILEDEKSIKSDLRLFETEVMNLKENDPATEQIKNNYNRKFREYMLFAEMLEKQYPRYYSLKYDDKTPGIGQIRNHISPNTLLIQYHVSDTVIYALSISGKSIDINRIKRNAEFDLNLNILLDQISDSEISEKVNRPDYFRDFCKASGYIYKAVLEPILSGNTSGIRKLVIIPGGELCRLPFELLLTKDYTGSVNYSRLPYLVNDMEIRYEYSVSLLCENITANNKFKKLYLGFAPEYNTGTGSSSAGFSSLIAGSKEIESCSRIWDGEIWSGFEATESMFRKHIGEGKIIHLGTHTYINDKDPATSYLAFHAIPGEDEDGKVNTFEIYNLDIPADLVILSGCETGNGLIKKGEGIISLSRAFKYAGCNNIIMSLWKVNDRTTCEIMIAFNKNLKKGMQKDRALQLAKQDFIISSDNVHPAFWSSFVLIGNDDPVTHNSRIFLIPAALIILYLLVHLKKTKLHRIMSLFGRD